MGAGVRRRPCIRDARTPCVQQKMWDMLSPFGEGKFSLREQARGKICGDPPQIETFFLL
jgi:hypothetical protein